MLAEFKADSTANNPWKFLSARKAYIKKQEN